MTTAQQGVSASSGSQERDSGQSNGALPSIYAPLIGLVVNVHCEEGTRATTLVGKLNSADSRSIVIEKVMAGSVDPFCLSVGEITIPTERVLRMGAASPQRLDVYQKTISANIGAEDQHW